MPKERIDISTFGGVVGAAGERDLAPQVCSYAENLQPAGEGAFLSGAQRDAALVDLSGAHFARVEEEQDAVFYDLTDDKIKVWDNEETVTDLGAPAAPVRDSSSGASAARLGSGPDVRPAWVGQVEEEQLGAPAPGGLQHYPAPLRRPQYSLLGEGVDITSSRGPRTPRTTEEEGERSFFEAGRYFWAVSFIYDTFQEGPLGRVVAGTETYRYFADEVVEDDGSHYESVDLRLDIYTLAGTTDPGETLSRRVTALAIYRATSPDPTADHPFSAWMLVEVAELSDDGWKHNDAESRWEYTLTDHRDTGRTYAQRTGLPPTLDHQEIRYGRAVVSDGYHFVGRCSVGGFTSPDAEAAELMVMRSQPYRYDMFDWTTDFVRLEQKPEALAAYAGRLFALAQGKTFVIGPETMAVEEEWEGVGCLSPQSVVSTDLGLFFGSERNIYHWDGASLDLIGTPVLESPRAGRGWKDLDLSGRPPVFAYEARHGLLVIHFRAEGGEGAPLALLYDVRRRRWWYLTFPALSAGDACSGALGALDGHHLYSVASGGASGGLYELFGRPPAAPRRAWQWQSHDMSDPQGQTFYELKVTGDLGDAFYSENGAPFAAAPYLFDLSGTKAYQVNSHPSPPWAHTTSFRARLEGSSSDVVTALMLTRRRRTPR